MFVEAVVPYGDGEEKGAQVQRMFDAIARRYDRLNHLLSLGFDRCWRRRAVDALKPHSPKRILDVASGTGDLAILMQRRLDPEAVTCADLSEGMMAIGRQKADRAGLSGKVRFERQDCMGLTYQDATFDAVTAAFGVRNFSHLEKGIAEMYRVLKPGGAMMLLELSTPRRFPMNALYKIYSSTFMPLIGNLMGLDKSAYRYLPASIKAMPQGKEMTDIIERQGFRDASFKTFTGGVCSVYFGYKS